MPEDTEASANGDFFCDFRDHARAACRAWGESWKALIPHGFVEKSKEGQREALLAVRSLVDVALDKLGDEEQPKSKPKVKVASD